MKDLVEYIAKSIASKPDEVTVTEETNDEEVTLIKLEVAPEDKGKVIGLSLIHISEPTRPY